MARGSEVVDRRGRADGDHQLHLDRCVQRQAGHPDRAPGVLAGPPKISLSSSLAPLATWGCPVNPGALAT